MSTTPHMSSNFAHDRAHKHTLFKTDTKEGYAKKKTKRHLVVVYKEEGGEGASRAKCL